MADTGFTKNFVVKNGLTTGAITLDAGSGNISGTNLSVTGQSDLGAIANVSITGGSDGYIISTDGAGNLSFVDPAATQSPAPMPTYVATGTTLTISAGYQGLFGYPITIDGNLNVEGILIDVNDATTPAGVTGSVQYNDAGYIGGDSYFTYTSGTGTLTAPITKTTAKTVATLPSASSVGAGARSFVTDCSTNTFLSIVSGGGSNAVPVVSNGSNWLVG